MIKPLATLLTVQTPLATSILPYAMWPKVHNLCTFQTQFEVDIFCGSENNLDWKQLPPAVSLYKWFQYHIPLSAISGHNTHNDFGNQQYGGTFLLGNGETMTSISNTGMYPLGLGCWVCLLYLDRQVSPHASSAHTNPVILLLPKPTVSRLSTNPTY